MSNRSKFKSLFVLEEEHLEQYLVDRFKASQVTLTILFTIIELAAIGSLIMNIQTISKGQTVDDKFMIVSVAAIIVIPLIWMGLAAVNKIWFEYMVIPIRIVYYLKQINEKMQDGKTLGKTE